MLNSLLAKSNIIGGRIDLEWIWASPGARPDLRLIRRTRAYSNGVGDGMTVVDLERDFGSSLANWAAIQRDLFFGPNTTVESNQQLAEFSQHFRQTGKPATVDGLTPYEVVIGTYNKVSDSYTTLSLTDIVRIDFEQRRTASWQQLLRWDVFIDDGGSTVLAGQVTVRIGHQVGSDSDHFEWQPAVGGAVTVNFQHHAQQHTQTRLEEGVNPDSGEWIRRVVIQDQALNPEEIYYYRLYHSPTGSDYTSEYNWRVAAVSTGQYHYSDRLYKQLPSIHHYYDEPDAKTRGQGQLRRYLSLFGATLDHIHGQAEMLKQRHNVHRVYAKALPQLARMIGWRPDKTSDALSLRRDILEAPEIFRTVGTNTNLRSVVNRVTGWDCKIKEFVHNIFLTNAVDRIHLWEIWHKRHDGVGWSAPQAVTRSLAQTDTFDGHANAFIDHNSNAWIFWHSNRDGNRGIWAQQMDVAAPVVRKLQLWNNSETQLHNDEYPTVVTLSDRLLMCWAANKNGHWDIWGSWSRSSEPFDDGPDLSGINQSTPVNLTDYKANDCHPVLVDDDLGTIWLFWQSDRRGKTDLWQRRFDGTKWSPAERLTTAELHHTQPAATTDGAGRIWLFWCDDRGDRVNLYVQVNEGGSWAAPYQVSTGQYRDEAPCAVFWNGEIQLFWHSNRSGDWQLHSQRWKWNGTAPVAINAPQTETRSPTADKEPFVMVDSGGDLRLFWRSQRRGREYQSRTIDSGDAAMIAQLGQPQDRAHYTYDTRKSENDYYARDTIGIYLTPDAENPDLEDRNKRLINGPLKEFIPINIRPVLFILPAVHKEYVYTYDFPEAEPRRVIGETYSRSTTGVTEEIYAGVSDNYSDRIPGWNFIHSWSVSFSDHNSIDFNSLPVDTHLRTWHVGLEEGG
ncbi:MAG: hypothetical protein CSB13_01840 [Chloroflexi bacterium]|nr:MAG: hypothetical protein CSB13_01840 [Chloroflexota bacterium]